MPIQDSEPLFLFTQKFARGPAIGDICGSTIEFSPGRKPAKKEGAVLFPEGSTFTDDAVMTAAIADCLRQNGKVDIADSLRLWGHKYQEAGYGGSFIRWIFDSKKGPYNSCGN